MWVQLNDRIVAEEDACVSVFDRGFTYGDGVFETLRAWNGHAFRVDAHLERMHGAAGALSIVLPRSPADMRLDIGNVLRRNDLSEGIVRVHVSRGRGGRGPDIRNVSDPTYVVAAWPLPGDLDVRLGRGARIRTVSIRRLHPATLPPGAKHANYLNSVLAVAEASEADCDDGLMLTPDGWLAECGTANFFFVRDRVVSTPALELGVLPGVTRALVLRLAAQAGFEAREATCLPGVLDEASEAFLTNSLLGVWPVRSIGDRTFDAPGPVTAQLILRYREVVEAETQASGIS